MKRLFSKSFAARKDFFETAQAKLEELRDQLRLTVLATHIDIDPEQAEPYYKMRDQFAAMSDCQQIWDTLDRRSVNRVAERSAASVAITREPVVFALGSCDLIEWDQKVLHLPNGTGGDLYIYPGFALYRAAKKVFAIIDAREIQLTCSPMRFNEDGKVPSDAQVVGQVWAKSNKDGSRDLRFRDNYPIPVVLYGSLNFSSPRGLHEEFLISNAALAERFAEAWISFHASFASGHATSETETPVSPSAPVAQPPANPTDVPDIVNTFANESENARKLALEHAPFWEYLLTEELLRSKLAVVQKELDDLNDSPLSPKRPFDGSGYMNWLGQKLDEFVSSTQELGRCCEQKLPAAWGKLGEEGDAIQILNAVNEIIDRSRALVKLESTMLSADPPVNLKGFGVALGGIAASIIGEVKRVPDELGHAVESARNGARKLQITLTFASHPQMAALRAEVEKVKKHPEWVTS